MESRSAKRKRSSNWSLVFIKRTNQTTYTIKKDNFNYEYSLETALFKFKVWGNNSTIINLALIIRMIQASWESPF